MSSVASEVLPTAQVEEVDSSEQYGEAFPALGGGAPAQMNGKPDPIGTKKPRSAAPSAPHIKSSVITQVCQC